MIAAARQWLTAVVAATLLVSIARSLAPEGAMRRLTAFTGGLVLLLTLLRPLTVIRTGGLPLDFERYSREIEERRRELEETENALLAEGIAARTEAYILDKAASMGLVVSVRVETAAGEAGVPLPWSAELEGQRSRELEQWMERELNIPLERQVWHENKG